jgi:hypothetical protein
VTKKKKVTTIRRKETVTPDDLLKRKREIYGLFLVGRPSIKMLIDEDQRKDSGLQDFVCDNLKTRFSYATGISIIEAVDAIVISQIENGEETLVEEDG